MGQPYRIISCVKSYQLASGNQKLFAPTNEIYSDATAAFV